MPITFFVRKIGPVHVAEPGLMAAGRQNTGEFENFKKSLYTEKFNFLLRLTKVQHYYSSLIEKWLLWFAFTQGQ